MSADLIHLIKLAVTELSLLIPPEKATDDQVALIVALHKAAWPREPLVHKAPEKVQ